VENKQESHIPTLREYFVAFNSKGIWFKIFLCSKKWLKIQISVLVVLLGEVKLWN